MRKTMRDISRKEEIYCVPDGLEEKMGAIETLVLLLFLGAWSAVIGLVSYAVYIGILYQLGN